MWGHSSHLWNASHAITPPTRRPCFGREYPAIRRTFRRKKVSIHSSNRLFACSPKKRTTKVHFLPLVSRWWIGSQESRCTLIFQIYPWSGALLPIVTSSYLGRVVAASHSLPITWYASIMNKMHMCCWSIPETVTWGCVKWLTEKRTGKMGYILPIPPKIR